MTTLQTVLGGRWGRDEARELRYFDILIYKKKCVFDYSGN